MSASTGSNLTLYGGNSNGTPVTIGGSESSGGGAVIKEYNFTGSINAGETVNISDGSCYQEAFDYYDFNDSWAMSLPSTFTMSNTTAVADTVNGNNRIFLNKQIDDYYEYITICTGIDTAISTSRGIFFNIYTVNTRTRETSITSHRLTDCYTIAASYKKSTDMFVLLVVPAGSVGSSYSWFTASIVTVQIIDNTPTIITTLTLDESSIEYPSSAYSDKYSLLGVYQRIAMSTSGTNRAAVYRILDTGEIVEKSVYNILANANNGYYNSYGNAMSVIGERSLLFIRGTNYSTRAIIPTLFTYDPSTDAVTYAVNSSLSIGSNYTFSSYDKIYENENTVIFSYYDNPYNRVIRYDLADETTLTGTYTVVSGTISLGDYTYTIGGRSSNNDPNYSVVDGQLRYMPIYSSLSANEISITNSKLNINLFSIDDFNDDKVLGIQTKDAKFTFAKINTQNQPYVVYNETKYGGDNALALETVKNVTNYPIKCLITGITKLDGALPSVNYNFGKYRAYSPIPGYITDGILSTERFVTGTIIANTFSSADNIPAYIGFSPSYVIIYGIGGTSSDTASHYVGYGIPDKLYITGDNGVMYEHNLSITPIGFYIPVGTTNGTFRYTYDINYIAYY